MQERPDRLLQSTAFRCGLLTGLTLVLRIASASKPYFADAFRCIRAIDSGRLVIHAPGYFLFNASGYFLSHLLHVSAGTALQILNIAFSVAGAPVFYLLLLRLPSIRSPFWLSLVYICSPIVWFSGDVHSSYAALTFFSPLLLLVVEGEQRFILGCVVWGAMMGYRPSDGAFVLPWMIFRSLRFSWKERLLGIAAAIPIIATWWAPTVIRFGSGGLLGPLRYSGGQAQSVAQGVLSGHVGVHALVNAFHAVAGMCMTWGLLTPLVFLGMTLWRQSETARSMTIFAVPGMAFFLLYYVADAPYFAYLAAAGMILAAEYLERRPRQQRQIGYAAAVCASLLFMLLARTSPGTPSRIRAVGDAYFLKYSIPSLKDRKDPRLAELLGACKEDGVLGVCK